MCTGDAGMQACNICLTDKSRTNNFGISLGQITLIKRKFETEIGNPVVYRTQLNSSGLLKQLATFHEISTHSRGHRFQK